MTTPELRVVAAVAENHRRILRQVAAACERVGRQPDEVQLVAAAKRQPEERVRAAWEAGVRIFGDNQVQEAQSRSAYLPEEAIRHLIGPLQSNKARAAAALFDAVHSIDRPKIAHHLERYATALGRRIAGFIEVNLGDEETKHGFAPQKLAALVRPLAELEALPIVGLMAIPPWETEPERARRWFRRLRELRDELFSRPEWSGRPGFLSMGMSGDFEVAVEEGATHIRIGTALFGPRPD